MQLTYTGTFDQVEDSYIIDGYMDMFVNDIKCGTHYGFKNMKIQKITNTYGVSYAIAINSFTVFCDDYYFTENGIRVSGVVF